MDAGADKVSLNSAPLKDPALITRLAHRYGSQAVWLPSMPSVRTEASASTLEAVTPAAARDAVEWAREAESRGAGEILLTSSTGMAPRRLRLPADFCRLGCGSIPVIASGGAGRFDHFADVFTTAVPTRRSPHRSSTYAETSVTSRISNGFLRERQIPVTTERLCC